MKKETHIWRATCSHAILLKWILYDLPWTITIQTKISRSKKVLSILNTLHPYSENMIISGTKLNPFSVSSMTLAWQILCKIQLVICNNKLNERLFFKISDASSTGLIYILVNLLLTTKQLGAIFHFRPVRLQLEF